jgi:hypothetical protein
LPNPEPYDPYVAISEIMRDASAAMAKKIDDAILKSLLFGRVTLSVNHRGCLEIHNPTT